LTTSDDLPPRCDSGSLAAGGAAWLRFLGRLARDPSRETAFVARNFLLDEGIVAPRVERWAFDGATVRGYEEVPDLEEVRAAFVDHAAGLDSLEEAWLGHLDRA
jgi:hypothetical protein